MEAYCRQLIENTPCYKTDQRWGVVLSVKMDCCDLAGLYFTVLVSV